MTKSKVPLSELFHVGSSKRVLKKQWKTEGVPFYRGREITRLSTDGYVDNDLFISESDFAEYASKYGVPSPGDIVITAIGTIGNSYIVREGDRFYFKDASVLWLKKEAEVSSEFINLWLKSPLFFDQLDKGNGATVDTLTIKRLKSVLVDLPSLPEQKRIVAILDEAFAGIDATAANTEKNLANGRELFESYLNGVFTRKGDGWVEKKLGDVCENLDSKRVPITKSKRKIGEIPYYGASGVVDHVADYLFDEDLLLVSEDGANLLARTYPIAFSVSGKTWVNNHAHVLRFQEMSYQKFIEYYLNSISLAPYVSGMAQPKLNQKSLKSISVPWPQQPAEAARVVETLEDLSSETQRLETIYQQKLSALAELKQSILQNAFAGELTAQPDQALEKAVA